MGGLLRDLTERKEMTDEELRIKMAAASLQGELAAQDARHEGKGTGVVTESSLDEFAKRVWRLADAMVRNR